MEIAVDCNIKLQIPSGPVALLLWSFLKMLRIWDSVTTGISKVVSVKT